MDVFVEVVFSDGAEVDAAVVAESMRDDDAVGFGVVRLIVEILLGAVVTVAVYAEVVDADAEVVEADASTAFFCVVVDCKVDESLLVVVVAVVADAAVVENANGGPTPVRPVTVWVTSTTVSCVMRTARA